VPVALKKPPKKLFAADSAGIAHVCKSGRMTRERLFMAGLRFPSGLGELGFPGHSFFRPIEFRHGVARRAEIECQSRACGPHLSGFRVPEAPGNESHFPVRLAQAVRAFVVVASFADLSAVSHVEFNPDHLPRAFSHHSELVFLIHAPPCMPGKGMSSKAFSPSRAMPI
jgi:hypothetical protein